MLAQGLDILPGPLLAERSTLRLGGRAWAELLVQNEEGFNNLALSLRDLGGQPAVLGRGSNILAKDGPLPLVIISCHKELCGGPALIKEYGNEALVGCGAGQPLSTLINRLAEAGLGGLEALAGIPGSVGGAVAMNAGSFGSDIGESLHSAYIYTPEQGLTEYPAEQLKFGYRHFAPPRPCEWFVVAKAVFRLQKQNKDRVLNRVHEVLEGKRSTQPLQEASAGSTFKNPAGMAAGKLLEEAGFKGYALGGMAFSEKHANFLVNKGNGTATQALELLDRARSKVLALTGIALEMEVKIWP